MALHLVLIGALMAALAGVPAFLLAKRSPAAARFLARLQCVLGSVLGLSGTVMMLAEGAAQSLTLPGRLFGGGAVLSLDALGAFFLLPVFLVSALGIVYAGGYWRHAEQRHLGPIFSVFWGCVTAGMVILILARQSILFMAGWEMMALASFFLICIESANHEARKASWIYLVATHIGSLCLIGMFALLHYATGSFSFDAVSAAQAGPGLLAAIFLLALVGFGLKAGIVPLHFWLPGAHANAPSHISAFLSGVIIKMGIYGLLRILGLLPEPPLSWAGLVLALGVAGGVLGLAFALSQHDLKRALAYSSVENIGIILVGVALAMAGRSLHRPDLLALGLAAAVLHMWNHSLFKPLLFLAAGSVVRGTHTREMDLLGGLVRKMPWTAVLFLTGALGVCGLPPMNGFVSELLVYIGLLRSSVIPGLPVWSGAALAVPVLALTGALALACFVKLYGTMFLGLPRTRQAERAHESPLLMRIPMLVLAAMCLCVGVGAVWFAPALDHVAAAWLPSNQEVLPPVADLGGLRALSWAACVVFVLLMIGGLLLRWRIGRMPQERPGTWDCGYPYATARVQYTSSSLSQMIVHWFRGVLRPHIHEPELAKPFALPAGFKSHVGDLVLDKLLLPFAHHARNVILHLHGLQQGLTHYYLIYILLAVVALLVWTMPLGAFLNSLLTR